MFGNHGLCGLLEEGAHEKSHKCLDGNLGDFGKFCKGLWHVFMQPLKNFGFFEKLIAMNGIKNRKQKSVPSAQIQILRVLGFFFRLNQLIHP